MPIQRFARRADLREDPGREGDRSGKAEGDVPRPEHRNPVLDQEARLAAGALLVNFPGVNTLSRRTGTEELLFKIRKNLFETLTFVARRPVA